MTMRRIADEAGISLLNVQHDFPTCESLLQAIRNKIEDECLAALMWLVDGPAGVW